MYRIDDEYDATTLVLTAQREVDRAVECIFKLHEETADETKYNATYLMDEADKLLTAVQSLRFIINTLKGVK